MTLYFRWIKLGLKKSLAGPTFEEAINISGILQVTLPLLIYSYQACIAQAKKAKSHRVVPKGILTKFLAKRLFFLPELLAI